MYNISKRERISLVIIITLMIIAISYNLVIEPLFLRWKTLDEQIDSKIALLIKNRKLLSRYKTLEEEYAKYIPFLEKGKNEEEEIAKALREIENISKKSSCYIVNIKPRSPKELGNYKEISFDVTTEGIIDELSQFMYEIEASKKMLRIKRFTITSKSGPSERLKGIFVISKIIIL